jgi:hypothetical protein
MPADAAVITALLMDRPMCLDCVCQKTGLGANEIDRYLTIIATRLVLHRLAAARCRACGVTGPVYALHHSLS